MSDNSNQFELYHKWFGIRPEEMPTNAYRLLGIALYEEDRDVVENAVQQRLNFVLQFVSGEHAEAARTIHNELKQVEQCLLNPESKAAYDQQLRQVTLDQLAPRATPLGFTPAQQPASGPSARQVAADLADNPPAFIPPSTSAKPTPLRRRNGNPKKVGVELAKIVVGGVAGVAIGLAVLVMVRSGEDDSSSAKPPKAEENPARVVRTQPQNPALVERLDSNPLSRQPETQSSIHDGVPNNDKPVEKSSDGQKPVVKEENPFKEVNPFETISPGTNQSGAKSVKTTSATVARKVTKPADPSEQLPAAVSLPSLLTRQPRELFSFGNAPTDDVQLELVSHAVHLPEYQEFQIMRDQDPSVAEWNLLLVDRSEQSSSCTPLPIASMSITNKSLMFHWFEEAVGTAARQLQNCLLRLTIGQQTHALMLRQTEIAEPLKIDLDQRVIMRSVALAQLPRIDQLSFEVTSFENFPAQTEFKDERQSADISGEIVLEIRQIEGAYLRIKTARRSDDELSLLVYPLYKANAADQFDLTTTRIASLRTGTTQGLASAERDLAAKLAELRGLESQYNSISRSSTGNAAQAALRKQQLDAIASKANSCNRRIASLQRRIPEMKARLAAIPQLEQLVSQLHNKAQLSMRIYVVIDGQDVTLYKAG